MLIVNSFTVCSDTANEESDSDSDYSFDTSQIFDSDSGDDTPKFLPKDTLRPLPDGSVTSVSGAYITIMKYAIRHNLTFSAIEGLFDLLHLLCPRPNQLPPSLYKLKKFFTQFQPNYEKQQPSTCSECTTSIATQSCPIPDCNGMMLCSHLVHIPLEKALQTVVKSKLV